MEHFEVVGIETLTLDVLSPDSIAQCVAQVSDFTGGRLDVLLNNAGSGFCMPLVDSLLESARDLFDLNVWSVLAVTQAFLPLLLRSEHGAMIVNNNSIAGYSSLPLQGIYSAFKAATITLTATLRLELEPFGIKVVDLRTGSVSSKFYTNVRAKGSSYSTLPDDSMYGVAREELEGVLRGEKMDALHRTLIRGHGVLLAT